MKILFTADVHIGRRSSRLPQHLSGHEHSCASAWGRVVELALSHEVDLVAISGDLVDQSNRFLEAAGPLESGLRRLAGAGIETVMVSGNHDHDVLPALIDSIGSPSARLLGREGVWERYTFERGGQRVHVDGWSFPQASCRESPLRSYDSANDGAPILTLLHADLEQPGSRYAPIQLAELRRHPQALFLLGHVHEPRAAEEPGGARYIYGGSPQAMDPGEPGKHGVWLLRLEGASAEARLVSLSSVRYETIAVSVEGIEKPEDIDSRVFRAAREHLASVSDDAAGLTYVRYKVRLVGATRLLRAVDERLAELSSLSSDFDLSRDAIVASIASFEPRMTPAHDLEALATGLGAPAVLAKLLRDADPDPTLRASLQRLAAEVHDSRAFVEVAGGPEDLADFEREAELELRRAAAILLDELLLQKAESR